MCDQYHNLKTDAERLAFIAGKTCAIEELQRHINGEIADAARAAGEMLRQIEARIGCPEYDHSCDEFKPVDPETEEQAEGFLETVGARTHPDDERAGAGPT